MLRRRARLDWWITRTGMHGSAPARDRVIADLALNDKMPAADIGAMFSGARHCPAELTDTETRLASALAGRPLTHRTDMPDTVRAEIPDWLGPALHRAFGVRFDEETAALNLPAPVDLRVNTIKTTWEQARAALAHEQVTTVPTAYSPLALRVEGNVRLGGTSVFRDGRIEVQDEASQLVAMMCGARPGMTVIDFCAGAGGKTLALAADMSRDGDLAGRLIACDVFSRRLQRMRARLHRAGAEAVERHTLSSEEDPWVEENAASADRVLLDVPCSGSGTWRRHPESKWLLKPEDLTDAVATQRRILASASRLVRPGGRLIYATCSLLCEENEDQVDWFVDAVPAFSRVPVATVWQEAIGGDLPPRFAADHPADHAAIRLSPASTGTDGFFVAVLERTGD
ncbi:MAG: RsmB/NOP family class I SAM-dependent RNA methyltransferase [Rhodospirillales bacterium]